MRNTGFFKGLYSKEELNSENVKERDNKIVFLQKTIEVVSKCKFAIVIYININIGVYYDY